MNAEQTETSNFPPKGERLHEKAQQVREQVKHAGEKAKAEGRAIFNDQKGKVAQHIGNWGGAVHRAAHRLDEEHDATIAYYAHRAADQLERTGRYLNECDWGRLRRDAENLARNHQEIFFGGMFIAGLALARFLKAAPEGNGSGPSSWSNEGNQPTAAMAEPMTHQEL